MKIIVAGGGKVGLALIRQLSAEEDNDITLIDSKQSVLEEAVNRYDVIGILGNCASLSVLQQADVEHMDLLIAAIGEDEVNLLCCMTAHEINKNLHTIARIRNPEYSEQVYRMRDAFGLSLEVNPERQAAIEIERLLQYPGFLKRESFAKNRVEIVEIKVEEGSPLCGCPLSKINSIIGIKVLVCAIVRGGSAIIPDGNCDLEAGDRCLVTAPTSNLTQLLKKLGLISLRVKRVMICGGGRISHYLARRLEKSGIGITIVEQDADRCQYLAENLPKAHIVHGDATNLTLLESEGLAQCDAVVSLTGFDEMNVINSLFAHNCGVPQVITKLDRIDRMPMLDNMPLGRVVNPKELCSNNIVRYVRAFKNQAGAALSVHAIADGKVEALEFFVDETVKNCGVPFKNLKLKKNVLIACISHGPKFWIPDGNTCYTRGDTVLVVTGHKKVISRINDIFEE